MVVAQERLEAELGHGRVPVPRWPTASLSVSAAGSAGSVSVRAVASAQPSLVAWVMTSSRFRVVDP